MRRNWIFALLLVAVFALSRVPGLMPPNFSAAYALAFCAGVYLPGAMAWYLPLGAMVATDALLNVFWYDAAIFDARMMLKTATFAGLIGLGRLFSPRHSWLKLLGGGLLGAVLFYIVTNFISWLVDPGYAKTLSGLIQALTIGLPNYPPAWEFFRNTIASGGLFTGLFVGAAKLVESFEAAEDKEPAAAEDTPEAEHPAEEPNA
ncbi:MAG: hypothetical protein N2379_04050 [Verrucomicrobiae bacterium]|nr:hypothetical protein [Verrucomicrobiae bacterium]